MVGCKHLGFDITILGISVLASTYSSQATVCACRLIYDENILYVHYVHCTYLSFLAIMYIATYHALLFSEFQVISNCYYCSIVEVPKPANFAGSGMKFENPLVAKYGVKDGTAGARPGRRWTHPGAQPHPQGTSGDSVRGHR